MNTQRLNSSFILILLLIIIIVIVIVIVIVIIIILQGLFPPGQGATIGVDFMIKTVEIKGEKVKVHGKRSNYLYISKFCLTTGTHVRYYISPAADMGHSRPGEISLHHSELLP